MHTRQHTLCTCCDHASRAPYEQALHAGFVEINAECKRRFKQSGTTATLVVVAGWEVVVASVGDSCAYMDTGTEIIQVRNTQYH